VVVILECTDHPQFKRKGRNLFMKKKVCVCVCVCVQFKRKGRDLFMKKKVPIKLVLE
jgi:hypothetical protein